MRPRRHALLPLLLLALSGACAASQETEIQVGQTADGLETLGQPANPTRLKLVRAACNKGVGRACTQLGMWYEAGDHVEKDVSRAARLYENACKGGSPEGCMELGRLHQGNALGKPDTSAARRWFERACAMQHEAGCKASEAP